MKNMIYSDDVRVPTSSPVIEREQEKPIGGLEMELVVTTLMKSNGNQMIRIRPITSRPDEIVSAIEL